MTNEQKLHSVGIYLNHHHPQAGWKFFSYREVESLGEVDPPCALLRGVCKEFAITLCEDGMIFGAGDLDQINIFDLKPMDIGKQILEALRKALETPEVSEKIPEILEKPNTDEILEPYHICDCGAIVQAEEILEIKAKFEETVAVEESIIATAVEETATVEAETLEAETEIVTEEPAPKKNLKIGNLNPIFTLSEIQ
jgi:hypothetical protein